MSLLDFARPGWLLALVPIALLGWRLWRAPRAPRTIWETVVDAHLLPHLLVGASQPARRRHFARLAGAALLAVLALAGPRLDHQPGNAYQREATRLLVVDLSAAMTGATRADFPLDRLKLKILDLLRALPEGQSGLIVYAGEPYLIVPPTTDGANVALFVPDLAHDLLPVPGNHPERALAMANQVLARSPHGTGDIVWITAGSNSAAPLPPATRGLRLSILHAATGDDPALAAMARRTGGVYARMTTDNTDVATLATRLATAGHETMSGLRSDAVEVGYWLLLPLLFLVAPSIRGRTFALLATPMVLAGLLTPPPAAAGDLQLPGALADGRAWRQLQRGDARTASESFRDPRWRAVAHYRLGQFAEASLAWAALDDADAHYNRGNALARQGKLQEALDAYDQSLARRRHDADTLFNRDLVDKLLRQNKAPNQQTGGQPPPAMPRSPVPAEPANDNGARDAARLAEQWLQQVPDQPGSLLRRKIMIEHQRRLSGAGPAAW